MLQPWTAASRGLSHLPSLTQARLRLLGDTKTLFEVNEASAKCFYLHLRVIMRSQCQGCGEAASKYLNAALRPDPEFTLLRCRDRHGRTLAEMSSWHNVFFSNVFPEGLQCSLELENNELPHTCCSENCSFMSYNLLAISQEAKGSLFW